MSEVAAQPKANDWLIVPNVRVGPITASSTEQSLIEAFGDKFVETHRVVGDVSTDRFVTLIYRNDQSRVISVSWRGKGTQKHPKSVLFCFGFHEAPGRWRTPSGLGCNTTLRELEALNGRPFTLLGYGRDNSGTITSWRGGILEQEFGYTGALRIAVAPIDKDWMTRLLPAERRLVLEEREIRSSDAVMQRLNPVVYEMIFTFTEEPRVHSNPLPPG